MHYRSSFFCTKDGGHWPFRRALLSSALTKELVIAPSKAECFIATFVFDFTLDASYNEQ